MRKTYELLLSGEFSGAVDAWTEWLCVQRHRNGSITLSSRSHEYLAEARDYRDEDGNEKLPRKIGGKTVSHIECDYVVGKDLVLHDDEVEVTIAWGDLQGAKSWLAARGWNKEPGYDEAWARISSMLS